jgi:hypothetical protein
MLFLCPWSSANNYLCFPKSRLSIFPVQSENSETVGIADDSFAWFVLQDECLWAMWTSWKRFNRILLVYTLQFSIDLYVGWRASLLGILAGNGVGVFSFVDNLIVVFVLQINSISSRNWQWGTRSFFEESPAVAGEFMVKKSHWFTIYIPCHSKCFYRLFCAPMAVLGYDIDFSPYVMKSDRCR